MAHMSFVARTHPQQGPANHIDDREITHADWLPLQERFRFTIDACAAAHNNKLPSFWTAQDNCLIQSWTGHRVWCNPPYSNIRPFVAKALQFEADLSVLLLPSNRTEQTWWQDLVEPHRDRQLGLSVEFLPGRLRFLAAQDTKIKPNSRPPFGCVLLIIGPVNHGIPVPSVQGQLL